MNQILIGISLSFIFFSCGRQGNSIQEKPQSINVQADVVKETEDTNNTSYVLNEQSVTEIDTSLYNQYKDGKKEGLWKEIDKNGG